MIVYPSIGQSLFLPLQSPVIFHIVVRLLHICPYLQSILHLLSLPIPFLLLHSHQSQIYVPRFLLLMFRLYQILYFDFLYLLLNLRDESAK